MKKPLVQAPAASCFLRMHGYQLKPQADPNVPRHGQQRVVQRYAALGIGNRGNCYAANLAVLQGDHAAKLTGQNQLRGMVTKLGSQHTVKRRRVATALHVAQHGGTHLALEVWLQTLTQHMTDAPKRTGSGL